MPRKKSPSQLDREIDEHLAHRGRRNPGRWRGVEVQSLLFERPQWTPKRARAWAKEHGFQSKKVHATDDYLRVRQFHPVPGTEKRTVTFSARKGIKAVVEQVR